MKKDLSKKTVKLLVTLASIILAAVILIHHNPLADPDEEWIKKAIACFIIAGALAIFHRFYDRLVTLPVEFNASARAMRILGNTGILEPVELWQSRKLIWKLSKNDFKNRYAGSYLGRVWAFTQPVVTVLLYWFVFGHVMGQDKKEILAVGVEAPYVLWLTAGLVPWFYFSEAINNGTTSLLEYSGIVCPPVLCFFYACGIFCLRIYTGDSSAAASLLHVLHVYVCACVKLHNMCDCRLFQGSDADYQYHAAGRHVGNPDFMEHFHAG